MSRRAMEPGEIGEIFLEKHKDTTRETRPVVFAKAPSGRESRALRQRWEAAWKLDADQQQDAIIDLFSDWVTGWENFPKDYSKDAIEDCFTLGGMSEIVYGVIIGAMVHLEDKKKSDSQP